VRARWVIGQGGEGEARNIERLEMHHVGIEVALREGMDAFLRGYLECALWSTNDNSDPETGGDPLDENYSVADFAPEALASAKADCEAFQEANAADLEATGADDDQNGHDFWLTRNGHGAGFWDRGYGDVGERLTKAAKVYGSVDLYVGGDGKVYGD
jgi:hypothetical protein